MIEAYLNEDATWLPVQRNPDGSIKRDGQGKPLLGASQIIKVNRKGGVKLVRNQQGQEVVSSYEIMALESIGIGDKVDGRDVIASGILKTLDGRIGVRVYLA